MANLKERVTEVLTNGTWKPSDEIHHWHYSRTCTFCNRRIKHGYEIQNCKTTVFAGARCIVRALVHLAK